MKRIKFLLINLLLISIIVSCTKKRTEVYIKPISTNIDGEIGKYVQIVDKSYKLFTDGEKTIGGGYNYQIVINIKNIKPTNYKFDDLDNITLTILDQNKMPLMGKAFKLNTYSSIDKLDDLVKTENANGFLTFEGYANEGSDIQKHGLPDSTSIVGFTVSSKATINYYDQIANKYWKNPNGDVVYLGGWGKGRNITKSIFIEWELREKDIVINGEKSVLSDVSPNQFILDDGEVKYTKAKKSDFLVGKWDANIKGNKLSMVFTPNGYVTMYINNRQQSSERFTVKGNKIILSSGTAPFELSENKNNLDMDFGGGDMAYLKRRNCNYSELTEPIDEILRPSESSSSTSSTSSAAVTSGGSENWDKLLKDYEAYTDKYIKLLKKASAGDMSAMTEYVEMLEKAQNLQESLENADDDMSAAQLQKFNEIQMKLINAASGL